MRHLDHMAITTDIVPVNTKRLVLPEVKGLRQVGSLALVPEGGFKALMPVLRRRLCRAARPAGNVAIIQACGMHL